MNLFTQSTEDHKKTYCHTENIIGMEGTCNECVFPLTEDREKRVHGICPTDTSLTYAASKGKLSCVKELIAAGADVNTACECHGNGPLMGRQLWGKHADCLYELINSGANVNIQNKEGDTALMYAAATDIQSLIELITSGADLNIQNNNQETALMFAARTGNVNQAEMLICAGAEVNIGNEFQETPLMIATHRGHIECLKELIAAGSDVNKPDIDGNLPLRYAIINNQVECISALIAAGADVNSRNIDKDGRTTVITVVDEGHVKRIHVEHISAGADTNKEEGNIQTALMDAANHGCIERLKELIAAGADINKEDNDGRTALRMAVYQGHIECLKEIIAAGADINKEDNVGGTALISAAKPRPY